MGKVRKLTCPQCGRRFSMAAHLARHQNAVHGRRPRSKTAGKTPSKRAPSRVLRSLARATSGRGPTTAGLAQAVRQIEAYRDSLAARRAELDSHMAVVDQALSTLGATTQPSTRRVGRGPARAGRAATPRQGSLKHFIERTLQGGSPMAVKDITTAIRKSGYKSRNKALAKSVGTALGQMPNVVKVSRGVFRLQ
jgi:uncharacterized C2H2 Zn-finger protein